MALASAIESNSVVSELKLEDTNTFTNELNESDIFERVDNVHRRPIPPIQGWVALLRSLEKNRSLQKLSLHWTALVKDFRGGF